MSATRILWGQILVVLTIVLITTWSATQRKVGGSVSNRSSVRPGSNSADPT